VLRKYGKTITYLDVKYSADDFEKLLADNDEFFEQIVKDIIDFIKDETMEPLPEEIKQVEIEIEELFKEQQHEDTI
jgi:hypothetical protein